LGNSFYFHKRLKISELKKEEEEKKKEEKE